MEYRETIIRQGSMPLCYKPARPSFLPYKTLPTPETFHYTSREPDARDTTNTLVDRSKVSCKGFDTQSRLFLVLLKFGVLNIAERRVTIQKKSCSERYQSRKSEERQRVGEVPPVLEVPRRVRDTGTKASGKRTLSAGVEAAREGAPYDREF